MRYLEDDDIREYDHEESKARWERSRHACQCDPGLPGVCPGPENCPMVAWEEEENE